MKKVLVCAAVLSGLQFSSPAFASDAGPSLDAGPADVSAPVVAPEVKPGEIKTVKDAGKQGLTLWQHWRSKDFMGFFGGLCMLIVFGLRLLAEKTRMKEWLKSKWVMFVFSFVICAAYDVGTAIAAGEQVGLVSAGSILGTAMLSAGAWLWGKKKMAS